jgi:cyclophilin family peptidyl-prolyl cis-trans isomerase
MSNPLHQKGAKEERPPIPLPDPEDVKHTFDAALAKMRERQGLYIGLAALVVLIAVGAMIFLNMESSPESPEFGVLWTRAQDASRKLMANESAGPEIQALAAYVQGIRGSAVEGEGLWLLGICEYREAWTSEKTTAEERRPHLDKAIAYLSELQQAKFDELLLTKTGWFSQGSGTPVSTLLKQVQDDLKWVNEHTAAEPLPNPSVVAVLRTSLGDVHLQFYDACPAHTKNFITLARKGTYNGTYFHFVRKGEGGKPLGVMAGDPYTFFYNDPRNKKHLLRWGKGGTGYEVPPEKGRYEITHHAGIVTSQMVPNADWDNGSQFMIMTDLDVDLDKRHTPFAKVVEGQTVVDKIAEMQTAGDDPTFKSDPDFSSVDTRDLAVNPVTLYKVVVYENGKALEHDFPLTDNEKSLATLGNSPVAPLEGDALYAGRALRAPDAAGEIRPGLDVPFPEDITDPKTASPKGDRIATQPENTPPKDAPKDK